MKLKYYLLVAALLGLSSSPMLGAVIVLPKTGLAGSSHDIGIAGCKGCHAPHNGALANGGAQSTGVIMNWARSFPAAGNTFLIYDSATVATAGKAVELGGALTSSSDNRMYSLLCLSCHDGVTSTFSGMTARRMVGSRVTGANDSLGLTNDHPVNMPYPAATVSGFAAVGTVGLTLPLYGSTNTVQCGTCHDAHSNVNTMYLRQPNNTAHCTLCHL
jgi:predicted CXXCH cytochrome family protein